MRHLALEIVTKARARADTNRNNLARRCPERMDHQEHQLLLRVRCICWCRAGYLSCHAFVAFGHILCCKRTPVGRESCLRRRKFTRSGSVRFAAACVSKHLDMALAIPAFSRGSESCALSRLIAMTDISERRDGGRELYCFTPS